MPVLHTCACGARIKMPDSAAGKKARCKACGAIFRVPEPGPAAGPAPAAASAAPHEPEPAQPVRTATSSSQSAAPEADPRDWLSEFSVAEAAAEGEPIRPGAPLLDIAPLEDAPAKPAPRERIVVSRPNEEERSPIKAPERSFWADLPSSFLFIADAGNFVTFVCLWLFLVVAMVARFGPMGMFASLMVNGYLFSFYLATILETASGDDELPHVWISDWRYELLQPLLQFAGSWAWVLLPALAVALYSFAEGQPIPWDVVIPLAVVGTYFWPVVILGVAIGGSFSGLWPHTIIRTAMAAPLAYLAIWVTLLISFGLAYLPSSGLIAPFLQSVGLAGSLGATIKLAVLSKALSLYAGIVAMRAIGLYYRHFKARFPWTAE